MNRRQRVRRRAAGTSSGADPSAADRYSSPRRRAAARGNPRRAGDRTVRPVPRPPPACSLSSPSTSSTACPTSTCGSSTAGGEARAPAGDVSLTAVAVFPFTVAGSAELAYLGEGMVDLLSAKLDGTGGLRTVDPRALLGYLARHGAAFDPERGRTVAEHFGAGLFILGSLVEAGGRLQLSASLYSRQHGAAPIASATFAEQSDRIWELVDRLAVQLLAQQFGGPAPLREAVERLQSLLYAA